MSNFSIRVCLCVCIGLIGSSAFVESASAAAHHPQPKEFRADDFCVDGNESKCFDILPPGQSGRGTLCQLIGFRLFGSRPKHNNDQLAKYTNLAYKYEGLTDNNIKENYLDHSFGVLFRDREHPYYPRSDVTIVRDRKNGIPHIYGETRPGVMFGAGYAAAEDRLFVMDVLRHVGRGSVTPFAGGAPGNQAFEQDQWAFAPYAEADFTAQLDRLPQLYGADGERVLADIDAYIAGINRFISEQKLNITKRPGQYWALDRVCGPHPFKREDVVAIAALVGAAFGSGGGREVDSALFLQAAIDRFGPDMGPRVWGGFRSANDLESPTTVKNRSFPYGDNPRDPKGLALPDPGSVVAQPMVTQRSGSAAGAGPTFSDHLRSGASYVAPLHGLFSNGVFRGGFRDHLPRQDSNALLISANKSASNHALAVFGPQVGYWSPGLLIQQELQGPGISAKGASFAGVSMYVQLGRGPDYAWSATSADQDITDTFAVELCEPPDDIPHRVPPSDLVKANPKLPTKDSWHYRFRGECLPIEVIRRTNSWKPNIADSTPAGSYVLEAQRTKLGIITHRATINGRPVAYVRLRSTYMHEIDSARGFRDFNDPERIKTPLDFQIAAAKINTTFNWFYLNRDHTAYYNSGANPVRAQQATSDLPSWGQFEWVGYDPTLNTARYTGFAEHPQAIDQDYLANWNNRPAPGYNASDSNFGYQPVFRVKLLDDRINKLIAGDNRATQSGLVKAMEDAATVDLRGDAVVPLALEVIDRGPGRPLDRELAGAVNILGRWLRDGSHRRDLHTRGTYDDARAIQIMDAWWPLWLKQQFGTRLGEPALTALTNIIPFDNAPGSVGSAYETGWYGYAQKDLRAVLGHHVESPYPIVFCGDGDLGKCRHELLTTLRQAVRVPLKTIYQVAGCPQGSQWCADSLVYQAIGGITQPNQPWVNRPTYQQVIEFPKRR